QITSATTISPVVSVATTINTRPPTAARLARIAAVAIMCWRWKNPTPRSWRIWESPNRRQHRRKRSKRCTGRNTPGVRRKEVDHVLPGAYSHSRRFLRPFDGGRAVHQVSRVPVLVAGDRAARFKSTAARLRHGNAGRGLSGPSGSGDG